MRSLQWYTFGDASPLDKLLAFAGDQLTVNYPDTAWQAVQGAGPGDADVSAKIAHAVMEAATNRRDAQNVGDAETVAMMTQRLLGLSQLRAAWMGARASTDLVEIERTAESEGGGLNLNALGGSLKWIAIGAAALLLVPALLRSRGARSY